RTQADEKDRKRQLRACNVGVEGRRDRRQRRQVEVGGQRPEGDQRGDEGGKCSGRCGHSASGCSPGAARRKASRDSHSATTRRMFSKSSMRQPKRRALKTWGTRQMSARVGQAPKQKRPAGASASICST